ncbi:beta-glucosidase [Phenylobacterium sp.]|uniref:beta-glucosidase family protein n=1 Tax=Phenylobacterium sp. TaxID=1871053 RepID=UPI00271BD77A|nr:glycoside hydrolase family 3 C-terminal domain-containing protein [Phenylobacterium sp.]MDO8379962.1 glycoside hydrolase family 3 C-terminal domain-containing protein [Phenylobacterium sp.]
MTEAWMDKTLSPDARAKLLIEQLTLDEMISLLHGPMPAMVSPPPADAAMGAGYVPGVERLGIPPLNETDASLGIANPRQVRPGDGATGLPCGLALASTWDPELAHAAGAMVGSEARDKGFNVLLGGGANLTREPRCGRNFEYLGEDPLLAGVLAGEAIKGAQSNDIVCTIKHFALNDQETCRHVVDACIDEGALRESDLLAFQIAIERGDPGSVMCAYNRVNGEWAGENDFLLNQVLKRDWGYRGWVMSDWGAVHSTAKAVLAGLDQESGEQLDKQVYFGAPLKEAVEQGEVSFERLTDMVARILRSLFDKGVFDNPAAKRFTDYAANAQVAQAAAEAGIVLLKNDGVLPLSGSLRKIAVIGAHADVGVLSGGGSSQVIPVGGPGLSLPVAGAAGAFANITYHPSAPLAAIRDMTRNTQVTFSAGTDPAQAADLARDADVAIVFADQWATEAEDLPSLSLPGHQDALIEAVAAANPRTVVVLETGTPVLTPWLDRVSAVLEAWYPGTRGGEAIANILFGAVNPSGRLPISFPREVEDLVRPEIPGQIFGPPEEGRTIPTSRPDVQQHKGRFSVEHLEGADVGYRWFAKHGTATLFPFGFGLSYTRFAHSGLELTGGETLTASFEVKNTGAVAGIDTPQVYVTVTGSDGQPSQRLIGWARVALAPGESRRVSVTADRRLLANYDVALPGWRIAAGPVAVVVGTSAEDATLHGEVEVAAGTLRP